MQQFLLLDCHQQDLVRINKWCHAVDALRVHLSFRVYDGEK